MLGGTNVTLVLATNTYNGRLASNQNIQGQLIAQPRGNSDVVLSELTVMFTGEVHVKVRHMRNM